MNYHVLAERIRAELNSLQRVVTKAILQSAIKQARA